MNKKMKIYFTGSIRGGRDDRKNYLKIIKYLQKYGKVLTEHIGDSEITNIGENNFSSKYIYKRDINWLKSADFIVAEVSVPSLGVGYEIAKAEKSQKKVLCLYKKGSNKKLSAMIAGSDGSTVKIYGNLKEASSVIDKFFKKNN